MSPIYLWIAVVEQMSMTRRAPVLQRRGGSLLRKVMGVSDTMLPIKSSFLTLQPVPTRCGRLACRVHPRVTPLAQIPWLMGIAGPGLTPSQRGRGMRQEGLCLLRLPPPLQLQTANDNILRGVDPHQRGPWAKKTTWEAWKWGGRAGAHGVEVKLRWCCLWVTSVWLSNMLPYQHCWALKS